MARCRHGAYEHTVAEWRSNNPKFVPFRLILDDADRSALVVPTVFDYIVYDESDAIGGRSARSFQRLAMRRSRGQRYDDEVRRRNCRETARRSFLLRRTDVVTDYKRTKLFAVHSGLAQPHPPLRGKLAAKYAFG